MVKKSDDPQATILNDSKSRTFEYYFFLLFFRNSNFFIAILNMQVYALVVNSFISSLPVRIFHIYISEPKCDKMIRPI